MATTTLLRVVLVTILLMLFKQGKSDITKDKQECASQLVGLATCLPFVGGQSKAPTPDCCSGLKQVVKDSKKCLCVLVKDRNEPGLGYKINATLALMLPQMCHAPETVSECPALLHLPPNSSDAKVFTDFGKAASAPLASASSSTSSGNSTGTSANKDKSDGGKGNRYGWLMVVAHLIFALFISSQIIL